MKIILPLILLLAFGSAAAGEMVPVVIIDAGHGGPSQPASVDESSWNNASFHSKKRNKTFFEKDLALQMALEVARQINDSHQARAILTRMDDRNVGMGDRARVAQRENARAFVSIHFNSTPKAKGPVAIIQSVKHGNTAAQHERDQAFGQRLAKAVESVTHQRDRGSRARAPQDYDIKPEGSHLLHNLRSYEGGKSMVACFLEVEFLDNPSVARWLVEDDKAEETRQQIAERLARAIVDFLREPRS
jgi:N-acetylmuramoyl-L-alanine amidase